MDQRRLSVSPSADGCINYKKIDHTTSTLKTAIIAVTSARTGLWDWSYLHAFLGHGALSATVYSTLSNWEAAENATIVAKQLKQAHELCTDSDEEIVPLFLVVNNDPRHIWHNMETDDPSRSRWGYLFVDGIEEDRKEEEWVDHRMSGVGAVLCAKMCGALASMGYDIDNVKTVATLVERNLMTANAYLSESHEAEIKEYGTLSAETLQSTVSEVLAKMFGSGPDQSNFRVNSNEAVLMINNLGGYSATDLKTITHYAVSGVQQEWYFRPVRVYAGSFMQTQKDPGFSITVLNVVNTDIGGPSMIQLLDRWCDAPGWNNFIRKEVYDGWNLVSREDHENESKNELEKSATAQDDETAVEMTVNDLEVTDAAPALQEDIPIQETEVEEKSTTLASEVPSSNQSEHGEAGEKGIAASKPVSKGTDSPVVVTDEPAEPAKPEPPTGIIASLSKALGYSKASAQHSQTRSDTESKETEEDSQDEFKDDDLSEDGAGDSSKEQQPTRASIAHPTFKRDDDSGSLIEMISKQSQKLGISGSDDVKAGNEYAKSASKSHAEAAELSDEDDYEVV